MSMNNESFVIPSGRGRSMSKHFTVIMGMKYIPESFQMKPLSEFDYTRTMHLTRSLLSFLVLTVPMKMKPSIFSSMKTAARNL